MILLSSATEDRLQRALTSLNGLSVGDAFGERFLRRSGAIDKLIEARNQSDLDKIVSTFAGQWGWTDDTAMSLAIVKVLQTHGRIVEQALAETFCKVFLSDPHRGYGHGMHLLLPELSQKNAWRILPRQLFDGRGSYGNGAAMRVAPLGAYFADDLDLVKEQAERSAIVTHGHPEAVAGTIAVAIAAALAARDENNHNPTDYLQAVLERTPAGEVADGIRTAIGISGKANEVEAALILGSGDQISAQDTVPFTLWCAANWIANFKTALWKTARGFGDMDTTCAIVGGIVSLRARSIPELWLSSRETLPDIDT